MYRWCLSLLSSLLLVGCTVRDNFENRLVAGTEFQHRVLIPRDKAADGVVHLYVDGDGLPFLTPTRAAADPTPAHSLVLRLVQQDPGAAVYLGRPCYLGLAADAGCGPRWWTTDRYAPAVVDSMVAAAVKVLKGRPVVLIGYSGGGTLAAAMAARLPQVQGLMTIAANLDVEAWVSRHGYTPLTLPGHLQAKLASLENVPQMHFAGERDEKVPPDLFASIAATAPPGSVCVIARFTHDCCWAGRWPELLAGVGSRSCESLGGTVYSPAVHSPVGMSRKEKR
jgi:alpha/beta hydrolase fold